MALARIPPAGLYWIVQKSPTKNVEHHAILDVGNRIEYADIDPRHPIIVHQTPPSIRRELFADTGIWKVVTKIADEHAAARRLIAACAMPELDFWRAQRNLVNAHPPALPPCMGHVEVMFVSAPFRIAVAGPGGLGLCAIREIRRLPQMQLVGVLAYSPDKIGKVRGKEVEARFQQACAKGGATLHGSGITPGFYNERLALLMTGLSNDVQSIRFQEFVNAEHLPGALNMLQLFGFGSKLEEIENNAAVALMAENYLKLPILFAADKLGIPIEHIERRSQHGVAATTIETAAGTIKAGTVGLVSYAWDGYAGGRRFYTTEVYWYIGQAIVSSHCRLDGVRRAGYLYSAGGAGNAVLHRNGRGDAASCTARRRSSPRTHASGPAAISLAAR